MYAHAPLYLAIVIFGAGTRRVVTAAARTPLEASDTILLCSSALLIVLAMMTVGARRAGGCAGIRMNFSAGRARVYEDGTRRGKDSASGTAVSESRTACSGP